MIDAENLTKKFDDITAVDNLTLHIGEGEVFGFLGPNGAGKTTTVRMLAGLISKTSGTARIGEYDIGNNADMQKIRRMIGLLPENVGLYENLSAYQNLDYYGRFYKIGKEQRRERIEYFLEMLGLWDQRDLSAGKFSKGMKQKLAVARALIHDPPILFLDEPTANLDPEAAKTVRDFILELKRENRTIFLNTHLLSEAEKLCDRVGIIKTKLLALDTPENLTKSLSGIKTVIQLETVNDKIIMAVEKLKPGKVEVIDNKLVIKVTDSELENPDILKAIETAGGRVQLVNEVKSTLEEVYLKYVRGE
ncbi:MAG: ATP-binding cassette domain-containing protein [Methanobacterium sp.]